jgi:hypothetical protein
MAESASLGRIDEDHAIFALLNFAQETFSLAEATNVL